MIIEKGTQSSDILLGELRINLSALEESLKGRPKDNPLSQLDVILTQAEIDILEEKTPLSYVKKFKAEQIIKAREAFVKTTSQLAADAKKGAKTAKIEIELFSGAESDFASLTQALGITGGEFEKYVYPQAVKDAVEELKERKTLPVEHTGYTREAKTAVEGVLAEISHYIVGKEPYIAVTAILGKDAIKRVVENPDPILTPKALSKASNP